MTTCSSCGAEYPEGFKFCGNCGSPLDTARPGDFVAEERRVVTALFCDLIGFTATSEYADPEDVAKMTAAYFAMARAEIEAFGGVVEKFIGDAVVGVFGVPSAHEDDPERAVRAGLALVEAAEAIVGIGGAPVHLRVGINTGEALVRLDVAPQSGKGFLTGDAINTASRIQSIAPEDGVAVGLATFESTSAVFDYQELALATVKGKTEPVRVFHAQATRARLGTDVTRTHDTPFIGREIDLAILKGIFDKVMAADSPQLVTVFGEPGLGKSRLVAELGALVDQRTDLVTWRQGRCLPYGEGITFWALGEILKAHAGILESDPPGVALSKLDLVLPEGDERSWFRRRLLPLLGIEATSTADREELFTAWRRFIEHVAEAYPTVLVFEDLHWADEALLAFLEHVAERAEGVPLLMVGTARPDLLDHRPDYAMSLRNATPINLDPLSTDETARLVSALLETTAVPDELRQPILERAGGNPLYAEEFVRLMKDKELLVRKGPSWELRDGAEVLFPDSVQALIAARLDTLGPAAKSMLADAAVVGKVFWAGAIAHMGARDLSEVEETLRELSRKELIRHERHSSIEGESEYVFSHVLALDVAYGQLPRASRASRHIAAAEWIGSMAGERIEDLADVLAFHYATALELAQAAGDTEQVVRLEMPALRFLSLAGERALGLDTAAALSNLQRALALAPPGHLERPAALVLFGKAALERGRLVEAQEALEEGIALYREMGDVAGEARAMNVLGQALLRAGDPSWASSRATALALLEPLPPSPELAAALAAMASAAVLRGKAVPGIDYAERSLAVSKDLGLPPLAHALGARGMARSDLGDGAGLDDMRAAIDVAIEAGDGREVGILHNNLAIEVWVFEGPQAGLEVIREGIAFAQARGLQEVVHFSTGSTLLDLLVDAGSYDESIRVGADYVKRYEVDAAAAYDRATVLAAQVRVWVMRGQVAQVAGSLDQLDAASQGTGAAQDVLIFRGSLALGRAALGEREAAATLLAEILHSDTRGDTYYGTLLAPLVRTAIQIGEPELAARFVSELEPRHPYLEHALVAADAALTEARMDREAAVAAYADAAVRWEGFGVVPEQGFALLGQGRCLVGLSRQSEASPVLRHAREIFEGLDAAPALAEIDGLRQATAQS